MRRLLFETKLHRRMTNYASEIRSAAEETCIRCWCKNMIIHLQKYIHTPGANLQPKCTYVVLIFNLFVLLDFTALLPRDLYLNCQNFHNRKYVLQITSFD